MPTRQAPAVYLDHQATTPVDPRVLDAMLPFFGPKFGNAASRSHQFGWEAEQAVEFARKRVAALAGALPREIVFTSGATESDNLAIKGVMEAYCSRGNHVVTMATEHRAVLDPVRHLERLGLRVTVLPPQPDGLLDLRPPAGRHPSRNSAGERDVRQQRDRRRSSRSARSAHSAAKRACCSTATPPRRSARCPSTSTPSHIDLMSVSAHKMYGPKGVGALYVRGAGSTGAANGRRRPRRRLALRHLERARYCGIRRGLRHLCARDGAKRARVCGTCAACSCSSIQSGLEGVEINGSLEHRLPGNLNLSFAGVNAETLLMSLPDVALSTGSACSSAVAEPSHVLRAIGVERGAGAIFRPLRTGPFQHRRRDRFRSGQSSRLGEAPAGFHSGAVRRAVQKDAQATKGNGTSDHFGERTRSLTVAAL